MLFIFGLFFPYGEFYEELYQKKKKAVLSSISLEILKQFVFCSFNPAKV